MVDPQDEGVERFEVRRVPDPPTRASIAPMVREERVVERDEPAGFSFAAGFFGWAVASFFTFVLVTLAALATGVVSAEGAQAGEVVVEQTATVGLVVALLAIFAAYVLGGYAAGRIALTNGVLHGASVVGWTILFAIVGLLVGAYVGDVIGVTTVAPVAIDGGPLTTMGIVVAVVLLVAMLAGAILGGVLGDRSRWSERVGERRIAYRGRPL